MYGAILGDIAGSRYEFSRPSHFRPWQVDLFSGSSRYTDDTVMSVAVKYALLTGTSYAKAFHLFGNRYPKAGYGVMFKQWLETGSTRGYQSLGNGGAMRVSFIGYWAKSLEEAEAQAALSADCTHNHPQGVAAAKCTAGAVYLALHGAKKKDIMHYASRYGYSVHRPLALYRPFGKFDVTAAGTMPLGRFAVFMRVTIGKAVFETLSVCDAIRIRWAASPAESQTPFTAARVLTNKNYCIDIWFSRTVSAGSIIFYMNGPLKNGNGGNLCDNYHLSVFQCFAYFKTESRVSGLSEFEI